MPSHVIGRRAALRRLAVAGLGLAGVSSFAAACGPLSTGTSPTPATSGRGTSTQARATIGLTQEPTALDPTADATAVIATCLRDNVYEGLVRLDSSGKIVPSLAGSWDLSPDGTTFTFHLKSGVRFHDGSPFSAEDVKFAWQRAMDHNTRPLNPHRDYWDPVSSIEAINPATVRVTLKTYSDNWLFHMTAGSACVVSSKSASTNVTSPIGTGPFTYNAWNRGASLTLARNDDYWGKKAALTEVEFRFITDAQAMINALKAGDIDAIAQLGGPEQLADLEKDRRFSVVKGPGAGKLMVSVNNTSGPLADMRVRQALYAAIDRKAWVDGVAAGYGIPIGSHAAPNDGEPYYADMTSVNQYDPEKARRLLQEAGQRNLTLRLAVIPYPYATRGTDILVSQLRAVGVGVTVEPTEFPRWFAQVFGGSQDYDLTIILHTEERDIGNYANPQYYWHYTNPVLADRLKQADAETDASKRRTLYRQIQQQLAEDAANLWVYAPNQLAVLRKNFEGYHVQGISPSLYLADASFS